ncbi:MAG: hypothetical protein Q8Q12_13735 [bacterium]|nr:hypothetical protein [bacterium]
MKKAMWLGLWAISACGAVVGGAVVARPKQPKSIARLLRPETKHQEEKSADASDLVAELDELREGVAGKESEIQRLREELAALRSRLRPELGPDLEKELRERLESRKRDEARKPERERSDTLWRKILQRKDKALREAGLTELLALFQSANPEDREMGFDVLRGLGSIKLDTEKYKPYVLAALADELPSVQRGAADCLSLVCPYEERLTIAARMIEDPDLRYWATMMLKDSSAPEHKKLAIPALRSFLEEGEPSDKQHILWDLYELPEELNDIVVKLLDQKGFEGPLTRLLHHETDTIGAPIVQRLADMYREGTSDETVMRFLHPGAIHFGDPNDFRERQGHPCLAEEAKPIVRDIYLGIVRDSLSNGRRREALEGLGRMGDAWVIPALDEISRSPDAEGIEDELAKTIEHLRNIPTQAR